MYIIKNALRCISRSKGRSILIGIISLVIAVSACIGLSIRQAAESAKQSILEGMSVTATISYDRQSAMSSIGGGKGNGGFDRNQFDTIMGGASSLTLEEYRLYATADSVLDFYYTMTAYFNGSDGFEPVNISETSDDSGGTLNGDLISPYADEIARAKGGFGNMMSAGDFKIIGYSSESAMVDFISGVSLITDGVVFAEQTDENVCIISEEIAIFNNLSVGDSITITNPNIDTEAYELTVCGIYSSTETNNIPSSMFGAGEEPANRIYMSAAALQKIIDASVTAANEDTETEYADAITATLSATYVFADTDAYYAFEEEARALGLEDTYTITSADITSFENGMTPLNTLSTMAGWFLIVILIIGAVILVVLNIFNVRERKYEVGVLTAMGMKKWKVAGQFMCEILVVTMIAIVIGAGIGAVSSVPVTNALLENQISSQQSESNRIENNFGRGGMMNGSIPSGENESGLGIKENNKFGNMVSGAANYITEVNSAMNLTVVLQMIGIGLLLTLIASVASVLFIMRYDPLKILANRD